MRDLTPAREAVLAGLIVLGLNALLRITVAPGAFQDDAIYLGLGKALASGHGWRSIYAAGQPVHLKYPPGLPAIYALAWLVGGNLAGALPLVEAFQLAVAGVAGGLLWWIARRRLGLGYGAATVALLPFGLISLVDHFQLPIAEGPFVAAWLAALALALGPLAARQAVVLGGLLAVTALLRTQGLAVVAGVLGGLLLAGRNRRTVALTATVSLLPLVAWWALRSWLVARGPLSTQPDEGSYLAGLGINATSLPAALTRAAWLNARTYADLISRELGPVGLGHATFALALALAGAGALRGGRRLSPLSISLGLSLALILAWPYTQARFVLTLLPLVALLVPLGWQGLAARLPRRVALGLPPVLVTAMALWQPMIRRAAFAPRGVEEVGFQPVGRALVANTDWMLAVAPWVAQHTPPGARIFTEGAAGLWLITGRVGVAALPPTANIGLAAWDGPPAGYLGQRIVADSVTTVIASSPPVAGFASRVERVCPGTLVLPERIASLAIAYTVSDSGRACLRAASIR
jgi:hypothetical protein